MITMPSSELLAGAATTRLRLSFSAGDQYRNGARVITLRPDDLPKPNGFEVEFKSAWRSLEALFVPDSFAGTLLEAMASADAQQRVTFASLARLMKEKGIKINLRVNDNLVDPTGELPSSPWKRFQLSATRLSSAPAEGEEAVASELTELALTFLNLVLSLLPLDEANMEASALFETGLPEGAKFRIEVNRYERSPINRAACIAAHGALCKACTLDFGLFYGALGEGYIVVHHIIPVSAMGGSYIVDPIVDLVPLCANCHAMVHRQDPPLRVEELRSMIEHRRSQSLLEL
jgi:5-methylcytosine-specific restriction enzyme A